MNVIVKARHMDVTDAIRDYVETKIAKLPRYYDSIQSMEAILDREAEQAVVEILVTARRKATFVASHRDPDMYAAVDQCLQKVSEQLRRHKDKVRDRHTSPLGQSAEGTQQ